MKKNSQKIVLIIDQDINAKPVNIKVSTGKDEGKGILGKWGGYLAKAFKLVLDSRE